VADVSDSASASHGPSPGESRREPLRFSFTRRGLLGALGLELEQKAARPDSPAYSLSALGTYSDDELGPIVPKLLPGSRLESVDGFAWAFAGADAPGRRLFAAGPVELAVIEGIDGERCLGEIAELLRRRSLARADSAFAPVRRVFLELVLARIVVPA
jgi:hypothetical protein